MGKVHACKPRHVVVHVVSLCFEEGGKRGRVILILLPPLPLPTYSSVLLLLLCFCRCDAQSKSFWLCFSISHAHSHTHHTFPRMLYTHAAQTHTNCNFAACLLVDVCYYACSVYVSLHFSHCLVIAFLCMLFCAGRWRRRERENFSSLFRLLLKDL